MFKSILALSFLVCGSAFAQDMSSTEDYKSAYVEMPDGSSRYVGKCSTHEDYDKFYFKSKRVIQKYTQPADMSEQEIIKMLAKFDDKLIEQILQKLELDDVAGENEGTVEIFQNYVDDLTAQSVTHVVYPELDLIRFNVGVGGGNGAYLVFNKVKTASGSRFELMSYTFDGDLNFCDKAVWLQKN